jgi:integrase
MIRRKDGRWQEQITLPGMKKPKYFYGKTQKEVKQKMAAWQKDQVGGRTFAACADDWDREHTEQVEYNTSVMYRAPLRRAKEHFAGRKIQDIGPDEIDAYINHIAGQGYSRRGVQVYLDMFRMIWNFSIVRGWAKSNPCGPVKLPAGLSDGERSAPTEEQQEKVKQGLEKENGLFAYMLLYTGLRRGELLALRWEDIDRKKKVIHVTKSVCFVGGKPMIKLPKSKAGRRDVVLLDALEKVLPDGGSGYLFGGNAPWLKSQTERNWLEWCKAAGLAHELVTVEVDPKTQKKKTRRKWRPDITAHQLRHAFATMLYDANIDEMDTKELMGHSSIQVTRDVYTHIRQSRREKTAEKLNAFLGQNSVKVGGDVGA